MGALAWLLAGIVVGAIIFGGRARRPARRGLYSFDVPPPTLNEMPMSREHPPTDFDD